MAMINRRPGKPVGGWYPTRYTGTDDLPQRWYPLIAKLSYGNTRSGNPVS